MWWHPPPKKRNLSLVGDCFFKKQGICQRIFRFQKTVYPFGNFLLKNKGLFKPQLFETNHSFLKRYFRNLGAFSENVFEFSDVASCWVASQDGVDFKWWHAFRTCLICNNTSCEKIVTKPKSKSKCGEFFPKKIPNFVNF